MKQPSHAIVNLLASTCVLLSASAVNAAEPLALQKIMKDLGRNMQTIVDGISRENWDSVEKAALLIADHRQPPFSEKIRIMDFVSTNMAKFKAYDGETHDPAQAVRKAAKARNGQGVISSFQELQTGCYNCHTEFRKAFVEHFYGRNDSAQ